MTRGDAATRTAIGLAVALVLLPAAGCDEGGEGDGAGETAGGAASGPAAMARSLGLSYVRRGELESAAEQFQRFRRLAPESTFGHSNLGLVRLWQGRREEAERHVRRALEIAPGDPEVRLNLAAVLAATGRRDSARAVLRGTLEESGGHAKTLYALAGLQPDSASRESLDRRVELLRRIVESSPANLAARVAVAEAEVRLGNAEAAAEQLAAIRSRAPELPPEASRALDRAIRALEDRPAREAVPEVTGFRDRFALTPVYQAALQDLRGPRREFPGALEVDFVRPGTAGGEAPPAVRLRRPAEEALPGGPPGPVEALAAADYDGDGDVDLVAGGPGRPLRPLPHAGGRFTDATDAALPDAARGAEGATAARFGDVDNDGWLDLYVSRDGAANFLLLNRGDGSYRLAGEAAPDGPEGAGASEVLLVDLEHDGDLDLLLVGPSGTRAYRNDGTGDFTERTSDFGFHPGRSGTDAALVDADGDVDVDLVVSRADGRPLLYENRRQGRFAEVGERAGLGEAGPAGSVAVGDVDHDGDFDLVLGGTGGTSLRLFRNGGGGRFSPAADAVPGPDGLPDGRQRVRLVDVDNDGWQDLLVGSRGREGEQPALASLRGGEDAFRPAPEWTPDRPADVRGLAALDHDDDGDLDVALATGEGPRLLRNDGGSARHQMLVRLTALRQGGGKNNYFGIGSRVEVSAGDMYQARMVTGPVTHFGLGGRRRADVTRVHWPNGVPQVAYYGGGATGIAEEEALKGSCGFLYAWDGERFSFVTDVLWRSALGMPVGIMGGSGSGGRRYAPAAPSREYRRLPGELLEPRDGRYLLQFTEELWETAYLDEFRLVAVDHPDSITVRVDERFVPAGREREHRLYRIADLRPPVAATDGRGRDLRDRLARDDHVYAAPFGPGPYQGVAEPHGIVLDLGELPPGGRAALLLNGWVYPTDASINVALAQNGSLASRVPVLQVPDGEGGWRTLKTVGFPAGKDKTIIVDLSDLPPSAKGRVRIRSNMQVYWDRIAVATLAPETRLRRASLHPDSAHLHFRGYSREFRKGGRNGPFWYDYDRVSTVPRWRPTVGRYTRYGPVTDLLSAPDDRYVVMAHGDEATLAFDASAFPELPEGWERDFLVYTEGWLKDADLNTATGRFVGPLPYHGMPGYPYDTAVAGYPDDSVHRAYLREYQTRRRGPGLRRLAADSTPPVGVGSRRFRP